MQCFQKKKNGGNESSPLSEQRRSRVVLPLQEINRGKKKSEEKEKIYCTEDEEDRKSREKIGTSFEKKMNHVKK